MTTSSVNGLRWAARILAVLYALFLSIFALDVFSEGYGFFDTIVALFMHLIPSLLIVATIVLAWRKELIGALVFTGLATAYAVMVWGRFDWVAIIAGPLFLSGILYYTSWRMNRTQPKMA